MGKSRKLIILFFLLIAALLLVILAASISQVTLRAGRPFSLAEGNQTLIGPGEVPQGAGEIFSLILRAILVIALVLLPVYILINLLSAQGRARLIGDLIVILPIILLLLFLPKSTQPLPQAEETSSPLEFSEGPLFDISTGPTDQFTPQVPPWLEIFSALALAALVAGIAVLVIRYVRKRAAPFQPRPVDQLAQSAQESIDALNAGEDIHNIVIRCYVQMSQVLDNERGINRDSAMTPAEFERLLIQQGFPQQPVEELTGLFQRVRYGDQTLTQVEEFHAINSLQAIIDYCRDGETGL
jgi:hypothetical protein